MKYELLIQKGLVSFVQSKEENSVLQKKKFCVPNETFYNFQSKFPKLLLCKRNIAGRTSSGQISVFTKGSRGLKLRLPFTNYNFRDSSLFLLGGLRYAFSKKKINALLLTSSGCFTYIPLNLNYKFFTLLRLNSLFLDRVGGIG